MSKVFFHSGDGGDLIYGLPIIRDNGPGHLYVGDRRWTRPIINKIPLFTRLLEAQPYITSFGAHSGQKIHHDFSTFRNVGHYRGRTICELQATWTKLKVDENRPWLTVDPDPKTSGRIVIGRTSRYNNSRFPWKSLVETFGQDMLFIGLPEEHQSFVRQFGDVEYYPTVDLYAVASAIAGSELYIGNQSSPYAICEGLKHNSVQEVSPQFADCIYARANAKYCVDGNLRFEALGKEFVSTTPEHKPKINLHETPPGGWACYYQGVSAKSYAFDSVMAMMKQKLFEKKIPVPDNLKEMIADEARGRIPVNKATLPFFGIRQNIEEKFRRAGLPVPC